MSNNSFFKKIHAKFKQRKINKRLKGEHVFESRSNGSDILIIILAGYKDFCKDVVFSRIKEFAPKDADICIVSSGLYKEDLSNLAKENNWSYISCKRNNVCAALNIAINEFKNAKLIYKLDEDIFITKHFFPTLLDVYNNCKDNKALANPSFVAPLIPINGYAHTVVLEKLNLVNKYEELFEEVKAECGSHRQIESNPDVAKFMWGKDNYVPQIDDLDEIMNKNPYEVRICPIRFSIGAILFSRKTREDMGYFNPGPGNGMGLDEIQICSLNSPKVISCNTCVGHLSFGKQNPFMKEYFLNNKSIFEIKK